MKTLTSLPSWVADYTHFGHASHPHVLANLSRYLSGEDDRYRAGRLGRRWNAAGGSTVTRDAVQIIDNNRLRIKGFCFGTVIGLGAILEDNLAPQHSESSRMTGTLGGRNDRDFLEELGAAYTFYDRDYERHKSKPYIT